MPQSETYNDHVVRLFLLAATVWGIVGMGLAYLGYYLLVARAGAGFAALYAFLVPPLGVLVAVLFDDHQVGAQQLLGLALLLAGLFLMVRRNAEAPAVAVEAAGSPTRPS